MLFPIPLAIYSVLHNVSGSSLGTRITAVKLCGTIYKLLYMYLEIIFNLVCNFSTTYRVFVILFGVARGLVNKSLRDMDVKFTTISSSMYSFALLLIVKVQKGTPVERENLDFPF